MPTTISGNGTISGLQVGGLPDGTIKQEDLAPNVAGNGPAFSAWANSTNSIPTGAVAKMIFNTEENDTANCYDAVNSRFQPTVAGYYTIKAGLLIANPSSAAGLSYLYLYKNGSPYKYGVMINFVSGHYVLPTISVDVFLNGTTDYVEMFAFQNTGATLSVPASGSGSYFQGFLARAA